MIVVVGVEKERKKERRMMEGGGREQFSEWPFVSFVRRLPCTRTNNIICDFLLLRFNGIGFGGI